MSKSVVSKKTVNNKIISPRILSKGERVTENAEDFIKEVRKAQNGVKTPVDSPKTIDLFAFSLDEIKEWRDRASKRITKRDNRLLAITREVKTINRNNLSDVRWVKKLNSTMSKKVFGNPTPTRPVKVEILI